MGISNHSKEKKETITFKVDAVTAVRFKEILENEDITISQALRSIVKRYVKNKGNLISVDDSGNK